MTKSFIPHFIWLCRKLSVYIIKHEHIMLKSLEGTEFITEVEKQELVGFFQEVKRMSPIFNKLYNKF